MREDVCMCVRACVRANGMCLSVLKMSVEIHTNHLDAVFWQRVTDVATCGLAPDNECFCTKVKSHNELTKFI